MYDACKHTEWTLTTQYNSAHATCVIPFLEDHTLGKGTLVRNKSCQEGFKWTLRRRRLGQLQPSLVKKGSSEHWGGGGWGSYNQVLSRRVQVNTEEVGAVATMSCQEGFKWTLRRRLGQLQPSLVKKGSSEHWGGWGSCNHVLSRRVQVNTEEEVRAVATKSCQEGFKWILRRRLGQLQPNLAKKGSSEHWGGGWVSCNQVLSSRVQVNTEDVGAVTTKSCQEGFTWILRRRNLEQLQPSLVKKG